MDTFDESMGRLAGTIRRMAQKEQPPQETYIGIITETGGTVTVELGPIRISTGDGSLILCESICTSCPNGYLTVCPRAIVAGARAVLMSTDQQRFYMVGMVR